LRAYRLDEAGRIGARREAPAGIMTVAVQSFAKVLEAQLGDWIDDTPIVMSGMIGSRQGWLEVPYAECPAGAAEIARGLRPIVWNAGRRRGWIAPGLSCRDAAGVPDVMRGEELLLAGWLRHVCVVPTHDFAAGADCASPTDCTSGTCVLPPGSDKSICADNCAPDVACTGAGLVCVRLSLSIFVVAAAGALAVLRQVDWFSRTPPPTMPQSIQLLAQPADCNSIAPT